MGLAILRFWNIKKTETDGSSKIELTATHWFVPVGNFQSNASSQQSLTYPTHCWLDNMQQGNTFISVIAWSGVINWIWRCISVADDSQSRWCKSWSKWNRNISVKLRQKLEQTLWHKKGACPWTTAWVQAAAPTKVDANKSFWAKPLYGMFNLIHNNIIYGFSLLLDSVFYAFQYGIMPEPGDKTWLKSIASLTYIILQAITISEELDMDCVHKNLPLCQPNINQLHPQLMQPY
jgi:hypothetical protein